ncbi:MAG TPA: BolA family transcriptional regulator [Methylocella sp.]|nr:BolA family transcriptional regulator [Methylocella sp.]
MPMPSAEIERLIKEGLPGATVEITDLAGDGDHYAARVISEEFAGKSKLQRHQLVYKALGSVVGGALHALQLQTLTPNEPG